MSFQVLGCPNCQQPFQVAEEQAGQVVQCPSCAQAVEIPAKAFEAQPAPPATDQQVFACPDCSGQFGVTADRFGQQVGCPHCQAIILIQAPGSQVVPPEPETESAPQIDIGTPALRRKKKKKIVLDGVLSDDVDEVKDLFAPGFKAKQKTESAVPETAAAETQPVQPARRTPEPSKPAVEPAEPSDAAPKPPPKPAPKSKSAQSPAPKPVPKSKSAASPAPLPKPVPKSKSAASPATKPAPKSKSAASPVPTPKPKSDSSPVPVSAPPPVPEIEPATAESQREQPVEAVVADEAPATMNDRLGELVEAGKEPIDHLLPPRFDVLDPSRLRMEMGKGEFKVLLPDGKGGATQFDQRVMHVKHAGHQVSLISLSPEQRARRRLIQNIVAIVIGIIIMAIAFTILR